MTGLAQTCDRRRAGVDRHLVGGTLIAVFPDPVELGHISANAEVSARTCQNDATNVVVVGQTRKYARKFAPHAERDGIARLRPIERYDCDASPCGDKDVRHFLPRPRHHD